MYKTRKDFDKKELRQLTLRLIVYTAFLPVTYLLYVGSRIDEEKFYLRSVTYEFFAGLFQEWKMLVGLKGYDTSTRVDAYTNKLHARKHNLDVDIYEMALKIDWGSIIDDSVVYCNDSSSREFVVRQVSSDMYTVEYSVYTRDMYKHTLHTEYILNKEQVMETLRKIEGLRRF